MEKLKRCPFCNGEASLMDETAEGLEPFWFFVFCTECDASSIWCKDSKQAIEAWNKRV